MSDRDLRKLNRIQLEREDRRIDSTLKHFREVISNKRRNAEDLRRVLEDDFSYLLKIPRYIYVLWFIHFLLMQQFWCNVQGGPWIVNFVMMMWLHKRWYRPIPFYVPGLSILLIIASVGFGSWQHSGP